MTADEAIAYLRIDTGRSTSKGRKTLEGYRARGKLTYVRMGRHCRYLKSDLDEFIKSQREQESEKAEWRP
jgi:hypothetical protein